MTVIIRLQLGSVASSERTRPHIINEASLLTETDNRKLATENVCKLYEACLTNDSAFSVWMGVGKATLGYVPSKSVYV